MKPRKLLTWPALVGFLLLIPIVSSAAIREIPVPNGSFEVMWSADETTLEYTVPFILSEKGITRIGSDGIGKTDWGGGIDVLVPGWIATETDYDISPFNSNSAMGEAVDSSINGHVLVAVNSPGWAASKLAEAVSEGVYTLSYGSGWMAAATAFSEIPNIIVSLQYSTDGGTTWMELEDAASMMWSNESIVDASVAIGEWSNDYYVAYEVASGSPALGAELRVHLTTDSATDAALADNFRLFHSDAGQIVQDIPVTNGDLEVMWTVDEAGEYTVPFTLLKAGLSEVGEDSIGNAAWGGGESVYMPGWTGTDTGFDFSPMILKALGDGVDHTINGHVMAAVNPPGWGTTGVEEVVEATTYALNWGSGWFSNASAFASLPELTVSLQYSIDGGLTWMELSDASTSLTNQAEVAAEVGLGEWSNDFITTYQVDSSSPALGGNLRVYITTTAPADGPALDRLRLGKVVSPPEGGPGMFDGYPVVGGNVDASGWLGWVYADGYPYVFLWNTSGWVFADESSASDSGAWFYFYK